MRNFKSRLLEILIVISSINFAFVQAQGQTSPTQSPVLTYESLLKFLTDNNISTAEEFVERAPETWIKTRMLMHNSSSAQSSSPERPRIILQNPLSTTLVAIAGGNSINAPIELIEWDASSKKYDFYEIKVEKETRPLQVNKNPMKCLGCHAQHGEQRPNWDSYLVWPGLLFHEPRLTFFSNRILEISKQFSTAETHYKRIFDLSKIRDMGIELRGLSWLSLDPATRLNSNLDLQNAERFVKKVVTHPNGLRVAAFLVGSFMPNSHFWEHLGLSKSEYEAQREYYSQKIKKEHGAYYETLSQLVYEKAGLDYSKDPHVTLGKENDSAQLGSLFSIIFKYLNIDPKEFSNSFFMKIESTPKLAQDSDYMSYFATLLLFNHYAEKLQKPMMPLDYPIITEDASFSSRSFRPSYSIDLLEAFTTRGRGEGAKLYKALTLQISSQSCAQVF